MLHLCGCWIIMGLPTSLKVHKVQGHVFFAHRYSNSSQLACPSRARLAPSLPPRAPPAPFLRPSAPAPARPPWGVPGDRWAAPPRAPPRGRGAGEGASHLLRPGGGGSCAGGRARAGAGRARPPGIRRSRPPGCGRPSGPGNPSPAKCPLGRSGCPPRAPRPGCCGWRRPLPLWAPSAGKDFVGVQERPESP